MIVHAPTCNIRSRQNEMEGKMGEGAHRKQEMTPCRPNPRSLFPSRSCSRRFLRLPQCPIRAILVRRTWPLLCVRLLRSSPRQGLAPTKVERNPRCARDRRRAKRPLNLDAAEGESPKSRTAASANLQYSGAKTNQNDRHHLQAGHRSISPNTMSSEPRIADTSASMCPRVRKSMACRCANEGARILHL
jgi:hypothetical protein